MCLCSNCLAFYKSGRFNTIMEFDLYSLQNDYSKTENKHQLNILLVCGFCIHRWTRVYGGTKKIVLSVFMEKAERFSIIFNLKMRFYFQNKCYIMEQINIRIFFISCCTHDMTSHFLSTDISVAFRRIKSRRVLSFKQTRPEIPFASISRFESIYNFSKSGFDTKSLKRMVFGICT